MKSFRFFFFKGKEIETEKFRKLSCRLKIVLCKEKTLFAISNCKYFIEGIQNYKTCFFKYSKDLWFVFCFLGSTVSWTVLKNNFNKRTKTKNLNIIFWSDFAIRVWLWPKKIYLCLILAKNVWTNKRDKNNDVQR